MIAAKKIVIGTTEDDARVIVCHDDGREVQVAGGERGAPDAVFTPDDMADVLAALGHNVDLE